MLCSCGPGKLPEKRKFPKVVMRGCKRSFGPREQEASCTGAKWVCTGAKEGLGGAKDSWETFAPWAQKESKRPFAPSPNHFWRLSFFGQFPRSTASQTQRALRDILMSRGKNCLPTVSRQVLTRNYPRPTCLLKCLPNCLSLTREVIFPLSKLPPR